MNSKLTFILGALFCWLLVPSALKAQFSVEITVNDATNLSTTCGDIIGNPDILWEVNIENQGWVTYPEVLGCHIDPPNLQFSTSTFNCLASLGTSSFEVCFRVYEDDAFFSCDPVETCMATICQDFPLPLGPSQDYTLSIPNGEPSGGTLEFTMAFNGTPMDAINNEICNAIDLGELNLGGSIGDPLNSVYNNFCTNSFGEPDPGALGAGWFNSVSVWFSFTTGPDPIPYADLIANSDPSGLGDPVGLQIALFTSSSNTCSGPWTMVDQQYNPNGDNELLTAECLEPNQLYWVLIDGVTDTPEQTFGYFGFGIEAEDVLIAPDEICDAIDLGAVPDGGIIDENINYSNECATSIGDPAVSSFVTQKTVWFSFEAPLTGHVLIESFSLVTIDPIGLQLAVFSSDDDTCNGTLTEVGSAYSNILDHQELEVSCLNPGQTYWLMIDGDNDNEGAFNFQISDAGEDTPVFDQDLTLCFGETLQVGSSIYDVTGVYADTIILPNGCDSIVNTTLTVLDEFFISDLTIDNASDLGIADGAATVTVMGSLPPYTYEWSDGQTDPTATNLVGGDNYCVTITDQNSCMIDTCFEMPFYTPVEGAISSTDVNCFDGLDGTLTITPSLGTPPYTYNWDGAGNTGMGMIMNGGDVTLIPGLAAGNYSVTITDGITEVILTDIIEEPPLLELNLVTSSALICFGDCNASAEVEASGGVGGYTYSWPSQAGPVASNLCAGTYTVTVTDANDCTAELEVVIEDPTELIPQVTVSDVSCFSGNDGTATVSANLPIDSIEWSTGENTTSISNLSSGNYSVTIWDNNGCVASTNYIINQPATALTVDLVEVTPVSCPGELDGQVEAQISGPGTNFSYDWSVSGSGAFLGVGAGSYSVTVTSEFGCVAVDDITITEPDAITATLEIYSPTCVDTAGLGDINVIDPLGGTGPYLYSIDGENFDQSPDFEDIEPGPYTVYVMDALGCEATFPTEVDPIPELDIILGDDQIIEIGESVSLTAFSDSPDVIYTWNLLDDQIECQDSLCQSVIITPNQTSTYTVVGVDPFTLCTGVGEIYIQVLKNREVYFPNAFSPNFDGINDYFIPYGIKGVEQIKSMRIFDRYGGLMYFGQNFQPGDEPSGWDGTLGGQRQSAGVYIYIVEVQYLDGQIGVFKGDVTLLR